MDHISQHLPITERGNLPRRIRTTTPGHEGRTFSWSEERSVYVADDGADLALPWIVRARLGDTFFEHLEASPIYIDRSTPVAAGVLA